ncbi:hypothetical protein [Brachybacterium sacelli]|uniref:hypothetical protein n=1 Tax=Brachybacterium sacelli TaxID=173364 RepID=UPI003618761A
MWRELVHTDVNGSLAERCVAHRAACCCAQRMRSARGACSGGARGEVRSTSRRTQSVTQRVARVVGRRPMRSAKRKQSPPDRMTSQGTLNRPSR